MAITSIFEGFEEGEEDYMLESHAPSNTGGNEDGGVITETRLAVIAIPNLLVLLGVGTWTFWGSPQMLTSELWQIGLSLTSLYKIEPLEMMRKTSVKGRLMATPVVPRTTRVPKMKMPCNGLCPRQLLGTASATLKQKSMLS